MNFKQFAHTWNGLKSQVKIQNFTIMVLALSIVVLSLLYYSATRAKRTVIVPSTIMAAMEVSDTDASPDFVRISTVYALSLLYSYTPATAAARYEEFLVAYVQLDKVRELRPMLMDRLRQIQSVKVAEQLEVEDFIFEKRGAVLVKGKTHRYSIGEPIATEGIYLRVLYQIRDGNLKIQSLMAMDAPEFNRRVRSVQITGRKVEEAERKRESRTRRQEQERARERERDEDSQEPDTIFLEPEIDDDPETAVEPGQGS